MKTNLDNYLTSAIAASTYFTIDEGKTLIDVNNGYSVRDIDHSNI
jgi:hypothetical protein